MALIFPSFIFNPKIKFMFRNSYTFTHSHAHNIISILCVFLKLLFWNWFFSNLASFYNIIPPYYMYLLVFANTIFKGSSQNRLSTCNICHRNVPFYFCHCNGYIERSGLTVEKLFSSCTPGQGRAECSKHIQDIQLHER